MEAAAVPHTYSSLDDALLQRMAATRLTPQLLSALMAAADRVRHGNADLRLHELP